MAKKSLLTFTPAVDFTGYPFGEKVDFRAGVESSPVPAEYVDLIREKGMLAGAEIPTTAGIDVTAATEELK